MLNTGVEKTDAAVCLEPRPDTSFDAPSHGARADIATTPSAEPVSAGSLPVSDLADTNPAGDAPTMRRCIASGETRQRTDLIRFAIAPDGTVTPDILNKLPGRGLWVGASETSLALAIKRKSFAKAAKQAVIIPDRLVETVAALLAKRCVDGLSRARRAGQAVAGFEKTTASLKSGQASVYVAALDAAEDGVSKLSRVSQAVGVATVRVLTREELASAFGREDAAHCALQTGGLADVFLQDCKRLAGFRPGAFCVDATDREKSN